MKRLVALLISLCLGLFICLYVIHVQSKNECERYERCLDSIAQEFDYSQRKMEILEQIVQEQERIIERNQIIINELESR